MRPGIRLALFALLLIIVFPVAGHSQRMKILNMETYDEDMFHFGFVLGGDMSFVSIKPVSNMNSLVFDSTSMPDILPLANKGQLLSIVSNPAPGFVVSIVSNMRMGDNFDLRFIPSLAFGDREIVYSIKVFRNADTTVLNISKRVPSTYINFPLEVKFKSDRYNNFRTYVLTGVQYSMDLASQAKKREQRNSSEKIVKFNSNDLYLEGGVGFDFYNEWFKFGIELKMMYGMTDILKHENNIYTEGIQSLRSKIFQISFTFE